ncbi:hypothetical protein ROZALSC1DRAFT_26972 [Rozella allomycis CSF55]|uniref:Phosphatidylinositol N-acetylglucosaminyltransferase subunit H conserved domain-containing protein n=1 Tax=Rozella allomycis (strain CSF55) TaxID=988480 RepID=A0A4P9YPC7_ROZAC|nr:hypothetical protein ROZALSC1DRAFT_26972 [Rozella allomycis CSF55]
MKDSSVWIKQLGMNSKQISIKNDKNIVSISDIFYAAILGVLVYCFTLNYIYAAFFIVVLFVFYFKTTVRQESVLLIPQVGIQLSTYYGIGPIKKCFIDSVDIDEVLIVEGITRFKVVHYLAIRCKKSKELVVLFENFLPMLDELRPLYYIIKSST